MPPPERVKARALDTLTDGVRTARLRLLLLLLILLGTITDVTPDLRPPSWRAHPQRQRVTKGWPIRSTTSEPSLRTRGNPAARLGYTMVFERRGQAYENRQDSPAGAAAATAAVDKAPPRRLPSSHCPHRIARAFPSSRALGGSGSAPEAALSGKVDVESIEAGLDPWCLPVSPPRIYPENVSPQCCPLAVGENKGFRSPSSAAVTATHFGESALHAQAPDLRDRGVTDCF